jgi:hypothetical protein
MLRRTPRPALLIGFSHCLVATFLMGDAGLFFACAKAPTYGRVSSRDAGPNLNNPADSGSATTPPSPDASPSHVDGAPVPNPGGVSMSATGSPPFGWQSVAPVGSPGWRGSQTPLCDVRQGVGLGDTHGVWADARGVFALVDSECIYIDLTLAGCPNDGQGHQDTAVEFNDGSGWRTLFEERYTPYDGFTGFPNGPLVLTRGACTAAFLDFGGTDTDCSMPSELQSTYPPPAVLDARDHQRDLGQRQPGVSGW